MGYAFPHFILIPVVLNKVIQDNADLILVAPIWQEQPWWPILLSLLVSSPVLLPHSPHLIRAPSDPSRVHPMFPRRHLTVCRISSSTIKQKAILDRLPNCSFQQLGLPLERPTSQHGPAGVAGVLKGKLILFSAPLSKILEFLANAFSDGLEYRSINVLPSAISSTYSRIDNFLVGQHPHVTKLMQGILNSRPPKPRYAYTWDVKKMTTHLASLGSKSSLSLKQLSRKLVMFFALACPERTACLAKLDLRY